MYKQYFCKHHQAVIGKKIKQKLSNTPRSHKNDINRPTTLDKILAKFKQINRN